MKYIKLFENFDNNMMTFYHGGNLDEYNDVIAQKNGRYSYGPGLYITDHLDTARKYAKGSRKLYRIEIEKGININDAYLDFEKCKDFIKNHIKGNMKKLVLEAILKYTKDDKVNANNFNVIILNNKAIQSTKTKELRQFYVDSGIDYDVIYNAYGWGDTMLVLYNMKKIIKITRI